MNAILLTAFWVMMSSEVLAASPFDGTWKIDVGALSAPSKPSVLLLKDGMYTCESCAPRFTVKADGAPHLIADDPYADAIAIKVIDTHTVEETDSKAGKPIFIWTMTVSADGRTLTSALIDNSGNATAKGKIIRTRIAAGSPGAHAVSGEWRTTKYEGYSDNTITVTLKLDGDRFSFSQPTGQSYTVTLGGPPASYKGDPGITTVSAARSGADTIVETDVRDGKIVSTNTMMTHDGKVMDLVFVDKLRGSNQNLTAVRQ